MCISPIKLEDGIQASCRVCWQCRSNRVSDWVGRNIAETETATVSYAVTLTYGRSWDGRADHLRSVMLTYSDIQKMLKRMRKAGYVVRYIVAGEYGAKLERAHWHGVFHFYGAIVPEWEGQHLNWSQEQWDRVGGIHIPEWSQDGAPMGHVHIKKATYAHTRYALKYLLKAESLDQAKVAMSRKPPLGYAYFVSLAKQAAAQFIAPQDLNYKFNVRKMSGEQEVMQFLLRGRMAEIYLDTYLAEWRALHGTRPRPPSELVDTYEEFGKLGKEERLTATRVENLPGPNSLFYSDNVLKSEAHRMQVDAVAADDWEARFEAQKARAALRSAGRRSNIRSKADWLNRWMEENGEGLTEQERFRFEQQFWLQARESSQRLVGLSDAEYDELSAADRSFLHNNPTRFAAVLQSRRRNGVRK
ncbi:replication initiation protein [Tortoise microvirus 75]|nr:replication initiation protein [Tortoise microvirus 75]